MKTLRTLTATVAGLLLLPAIASAHQIVHDAEHYLLEAQHGERWAAEDRAIDAKLAVLKQKHGRRPNLIHIMWDDTPLGEIGIPEIQKLRGFETPNMNIARRRRGD